MKKARDDLALVIGGEKEALATRNGEETLVLLGRNGFVKLALMYGYHLVPTYAFGQTELFTVNQTLFGSFRASLQRRLKISCVSHSDIQTPVTHLISVMPAHLY